jgi:hypothetical protein
MLQLLPLPLLLLVHAVEEPLLESCVLLWREALLGGELCRGIDEDLRILLELLLQVGRLLLEGLVLLILIVLVIILLVLLLLVDLRTAKVRTLLLLLLLKLLLLLLLLLLRWRPLRLRLILLVAPLCVAQTLQEWVFSHGRHRGAATKRVRLDGPRATAKYASLLRGGIVE